MPQENAENFVATISIDEITPQASLDKWDQRQCQAIKDRLHLIEKSFGHVTLKTTGSLSTNEGLWIAVTNSGRILVGENYLPNDPHEKHSLRIREWQLNQDGYQLRAVALTFPSSPVTVDGENLKTGVIMPGKRTSLNYYAVEQGQVFPGNGIGFVPVLIGRIEPRLK